MTKNIPTSEEKTTSDAAAALAEPAAWVGIDWADQKHVVALQCAGSQKVETSELKQHPEELASWIANLRLRFGGRPVRIALEQSKGALIHALLGHDFLQLVPVNPNTVSQMRKAFRISGAKDDPSDARLLLEILCKHGDRLRVWNPETKEVRLLGLLVQERRATVDAITRLTLSLGATLKGYYPQLLDLVESNLGTRLACELLIKYPDFSALKKARPQTLRDFFYARNFRRPELLEKRLKALDEAVPLTEDKAVIAANSIRAVRLAKQILALLPCLQQCEKELSALFKSLPDAKIFLSFPGAGEVLAPRLLALFGSDRNRWKNAQEVATYTGVAPVVERSGKQCVVRWRWGCPKFLRQSLHEFAASSLLFCPWAKKHYERQIQRGKHHHAAVRSVAFKWVRVLYRCWKNHCQYDASLYQPAQLAEIS
jgi:transposase